MTALCILTDKTHPPTFKRAQQLADQLQLHLPLTSRQTCQKYHLCLEVCPDRLQIFLPNDKRIKPFYVDFLSSKWAYRRGLGNPTELLAKAVGISPGYRPSIWDVTAGWGADACVLAGLGCRLLMVERHAVVRALLSDGLKRLKMNEWGASLNVSLSSSTLYELPATYPLPEVIYLDPMYPTQNKQAGIKWPMRLLRILVGDDKDASEVLNWALMLAVKRVVVKRPLRGPQLNHTQPNWVIRGRSCRFDVYGKGTGNLI